MSEFNRAVAGLRADLAEHPLTKDVMSSDQALLGFKAAIDAALGRGDRERQVRPSGPCDNRFGRPDNGLLRYTVFVTLGEDKPANEVRASGRGSDGDDSRVEDMA
jgi:hypothetical protein